MSECWIIANKADAELESNMLYYKTWAQNISGLVEVITLLELIIIIIERKGRHISQEKIRIGMDYKRVYKKIINDINKSNEYAQEVGAKISMTKRIIKKMQFEVEIQLLRGHKENIG